MHEKSEYELERDKVFVNDLNLAIDPLQAIQNVHSRDSSIHEDYVLEKLRLAQIVIENSIGYWSSKKENKNEKDN